MAGSSKVRTVSLRFLMMAVYVAAFYADVVTVRDCPKPHKFFPVLKTYGGRFTYFTHITLWLNFIYFIVAFLLELTSLRGLQVYSDWFFTSLCWCSSWVASVFFWVLFFMDREFIYPSFMEEYIPANGLLNHIWHTLPMIMIFLECILFKHHYHSKAVVASTIVCLGSAYTAWILYLYNMTGHWAYPFMKHFTPFMFGLFIVGSVMTCGVFYCIGLLVARACGNIKSAKLKSS